MPRASAPKRPPSPSGWQERWVKIRNQNTDLKIGYCLDPQTSPPPNWLPAGKNTQFVATMLHAGLLTPALLKTRLQLLPLDNARKVALQHWVDSTTAHLSAGKQAAR